MGGVPYASGRSLTPAELSHCQFQTSGLNREGTLKHDYPMHGIWYLLVTGSGSGIKHNLITVPTTRKSWLGWSCFLPSPANLVLTLLSGFVTKSQ